MFMHKNSAQPMHCKLNSISAEFIRIRRLCSSIDDFNLAADQLTNKLIKCGYDNKIINKGKTKAMNHNAAPYHKEKRVYVEFPFVNDQFQSNVSRIIKNLKLPIVLVNKNRNNLRNILKNSTENFPSCKKRSCFINNDKLCFKKTSCILLLATTVISSILAAQHNFSTTEFINTTMIVKALFTITETIMSVPNRHLATV